ncbi:MAG: M20 family metallopeptidase [Actinomycetota bacterium]|nr:M20 family metallopeptidase [Actinomycetota bacterium]
MTLNAKEIVISDNTAAADAIVDLSHRVWDTPEIAFEEYETAEMTSRILADAGFEVETEITDLPTAWSATYGSGELNVTICAELDALPDIGHACGHNVIAAAGVGAGLALQRVADDLGITVRVLGTPAEEQGGGKILMLERGAFDGTHMAMMVHPSPNEGDRFPTLAISQCDFHFHGRTAHASVTPHLGVNAADAITIAQVAIGLLRQHLDPEDQVHGIVTKGGEAANIVPGNASARYFYRSVDLEALSRLEPRVRACFEAGAAATGATLEVESLGPPYSEFTHDLDLVDKYRKNAESLGRSFDPTPRKGAGSTDMANVSLLMPTIHPMLGLDSGSAVNHQPEFAAYCRTPVADEAAVQGALAMALTAVDAATDEGTRERLLRHDTSYSDVPKYPWSF